MHSPAVQKLIDLFSKFPTVGPRTAARFVFYLLSLPSEEIDTLQEAISQVKEKVKLCSECFKSFEPSLAEAGSKTKLCEICQDLRRNQEMLCLVEKETDLLTLEKLKKYQGLYFILGGTVSGLRKTSFKKIRTEKLLERLKENKIKEVIMALNPTTEGEATFLYLERKLRPFNLKITRLGRGLPLGAELEYADQETLSSALEGRR